MKSTLISGFLLGTALVAVPAVASAETSTSGFRQSLHGPTQRYRTWDQEERRERFDPFNRGGSRDYGRRYRDEREYGRGPGRGFWPWNWSGGGEDASALVDLVQPKKKKELVLDRATLLEPQSPLVDASLEAERPEGAHAGAVYDWLKGANADPVHVRSGDVKAVVQFYAGRNFDPVWTGDGGLNDRARRMLKILAMANAEGLHREAYLPSSLQGFDVEAAEAAGDNVNLARLELELTRSALLYARHVSTGRVAPDKISVDIDVQVKDMAAAEILNALGHTVRPGAYLVSLAPPSESYRRLKTLLGKYRAIETGGGWTEVPAIGKLKLGSKDDGVPLLRQRLMETGEYVPPAPPKPAAGNSAIKTVSASGSGPEEAGSEDAAAQDTAPESGAAEDSGKAAPGSGTDTGIMASRVFDRALADAVKAFQTRHGLEDDGVVGPATLAVLNTKVSKRIEQISLNMERRRWMPRDMGETYILVNQAEFRMRMYDAGKVIHEARVVVGKPNYQTAEFNDEMETVVLNPYWNVPRSIATAEMLPNLLRNPSYLSESGYEVTDARGRKVHSGDVDWQNAAYNGFKYDIRQTPGTSNALGLVKFLFPNKHAIYLHDTPSKSLFAKTQRTFSHGCVRVQDAISFAETLLGREGWTPQQIEAGFASRKNQQVALHQHIPVYLTYQTAWVSDDGVANFREDVYGRDERVKTALGYTTLALK